MYKNSNAARKIDENRIIRIKKNNKKNKRFKNRLINFIFTFCIFITILSFIFIFLFNQAKSNEFTYKNFKNQDENLKYSENFLLKDKENFECISCATEDKIIL